jgi:hypothetical protein
LIDPFLNPDISVLCPFHGVFVSGWVELHGHLELGFRFWLCRLHTGDPGGVIPDGAFLGHGEATYHAKEAWDYGVVSDFIATAIFSAW